MIVPMKRVVVLGLASHTESILESLQDIGVVHVRHVKPPESRSLETLVEDIRKATVVLEVLPQGSEAPAAGGGDGLGLVHKLYQLRESRKALEGEIDRLEREAQRVSYLGPFDPADLGLLAKKGVSVRLFQCSQKKLAEIPADLPHTVVGERGKNVVVAMVSYREEGPLPLEEVPIPPRSVKEIEEIAKEKKAELDRVRGEIAGHARYRECVRKTLVDLENQRDLERVRVGKGEEAQVIYITGYFPAPEIDNLRRAAEANAWGLLVDDPSDDEEPPTLLKNPRWVRLIEPVISLMKTVPGYREFDVSVLFLLFLSVFFGMLVGDGAYGTIFLGATAFAHRKFGKKVRQKEIFYLMYVFSACTLGWGTVTGNWFGVKALADMSPFKDMVVPSLNAYSDVSRNTIIHLSFVIGVVHMTIGHLLVAVRNMTIFTALDQVGWIGILWSAFFVARKYILGWEFPGFFFHLLVGGLAAVLLALLVEGRKRKHVLIGIWDIFMGSIGAFADTVSYIRLFAVGMATFAVATSFNSIATQVGFSSVVRGFGAALILAFGHGLNLVLSLLSVMVHGVRLNMLEFSTHAGISWSGYEYSPFVKKSLDVGMED